MRWRCRITGLVQGVGFRPAVYRLATERGLSGWVRNDPGGVMLEIEGPVDALEAFKRQLLSAPPPLARIDAFEAAQVAATGEKGFRILASDEGEGKAAPVSPDMTVCDACLREMRDPSDRRYGYPFINCTDCGPRYTITRTVPYDRPNTSMASFVMCDACRAEYEDPASRRYHAQPIACPECGPRVEWRRENGEWRMGEEAIVEAARLLKEGKIVAVKGLGGFHLMCDATNDEAVRTLRARKRRPSKPFALMVKDLETAKALAQMNEVEEALLQSKERPIVLLKKITDSRSPFTVHRSPTSHSRFPIPDSRISDLVAPGIDRLGLMLPYTPLHHLLFDHLDVPLVATSANLSDEPIVREYEELMAKLGDVVDGVLDHDRPIVNAVDDSVAQVVGGEWVQWLRVARGVAPLTLPLKKGTPFPILAVGAQQKNTIALALEERMVLSPHIGDLGSLEAMDYFERTVETFRRFYDFTPRALACDLHPGYDTTRWAERYVRESGMENRESGIGNREWERGERNGGERESEPVPNSTLNTQHSTLIKVQHHHAHALAAMAEHGVEGKVLAFVWDGTGYGTDGTVWGGEVLLADARGFERVGYLRPFRLLGGEKAVREPRRVALSLLFELFGLEEVMAMENPAVRAFAPAEIRLLHQAWRKGLGAPLSTSMGRLFDAVASLSGLCQKVGYEGESGLLLERAAGTETKSGAEGLLRIAEGDEGFVIDWEPMVRRLSPGAEKPVAAAFHEALAEMIGEVAKRYPELPVVLTGGVFQNRTLCETVLPKLSGRELLLPRRTPVNDGAVALGQLWYALHHLS